MMMMMMMTMNDDPRYRLGSAWYNLSDLAGYLIETGKFEEPISRAPLTPTDLEHMAAALRDKGMGDKADALLQAHLQPARWVLGHHGWAVLRSVC
jgi:hypothetical protein